MTDKNDPLELLTTKPNEMEAALVVNALEMEGIKAIATGEHTSMFKAEAPGRVAVHVKASDLERARAVLNQFEDDD
jgi:hypothetical protein